ncbi:S-methyl-5-thioribose-1-phosphate isomerase [Candidatus Hodarchaeum mangrovi]
MKLKIDGIETDKPAVWWDVDSNTVKMIDQTKIPFEIKIVTCTNYHETVLAIKNMIIRGAPSIGAAGAYGLTQAVFEFSDRKDFQKQILIAYQELLNSRPTAVDLKNGLEKIISSLSKTPEEILKVAEDFAFQIKEEGLKIGIIGKDLIKNGMNILTHCHTGALALVDHGSAIAPLKQAWREGMRFHVFVDETRPRIQGKITSWELGSEKINHTVICDSVAGFLMSQGRIDLIILGADRVAMNGDIANKIGTYNLAILASYHKIPFYTAFPISTFDRQTKTGKEIVIEERENAEIKYVWGFNSQESRYQHVSLYLNETNFYNPAFDITPNELITGYITSKGILAASELEKKL